MTPKILQICNYNVRSDSHSFPDVGLLTGVLGVIILLKNDITCSLAIIVNAGLKILLQNLGIKLPIHPPINPACKTRSFPQHASPDHQVSSTKLYSSLHQPLTQVFSRLFPHPLPSI